MKQHRLGLDAASSRRSMDENGFLRVAGSHITKAAVNPYYGREVPGWEEAGLAPDSVYMGLRDAEELRRSLDSWRGLPLLIEHHIDSADAPQKEARVGTVGTDVAWSEPYVDATLVIWDLRAIQAVEDGSYRELSCAYRYEPDFAAGEWEGQPYDFVMRNIRGNHVALVEEGRAGPDVVVADHRLPRHGESVVADHRLPRSASETISPQIVSESASRAHSEGARHGESMVADHRLGSGLCPKPGRGQKNQLLTREGIMSHFKDWFRGTRDNANGDMPNQMGNTNAEEAMEQDMQKMVQSMVEELGLSPAQAEKLLARVRSMNAEKMQEVQSMPCSDENPYGDLGCTMEGDTMEKDDDMASDDLVTSIKSLLDSVIMNDEDRVGLGISLLALFQSLANVDVTADSDGEMSAKNLVMAEQVAAPTLAADAARRHSSSIRKAAVSETKALFRALSDAARDVRPVIGDIDPLSFDSADDIYAAALKASGVEPRQYHRSAWRGMFAMLDKQTGFAADARLAERPLDRMTRLDGKFSGLNNISLG